MKKDIISAVELTLKHIKMPLPKLGRPLKDKSKYTIKKKHKNKEL